MNDHETRTVRRTVDPEVTSLAQVAGATLVAVMTTDAWQRVREGMSHLWRRIQPHRADTVAIELDTSREDVLAASAADDEETLVELRAQWQGRFRRLLAAEPEAAEELRRLLDLPDSPGAAAARVIDQHATASGHARIYQAGRDQHIAES